MGWSGGTEIFDKVASELEELSWRWVREYNHEDFMVPLTNLYLTLCSLDWDTESESRYWNHDVIGKILGNTFEEGD